MRDARTGTLAVIIPFLPLALRNRIRETNHRVRIVCNAALVFGWEHSSPTLATVRWLDEWKRHVRQTQDRVLRRWRSGELSTADAVRCMDEELEASAPRVLGFP